MSLFCHKSFLCIITNHFFFFYHQSFLVLPQIISKCMIFSEWVIVVYSQLSSFFSYIMERTIYISMRWLLSPLWTRPTLFVEIIIVLSHWSNSLQIGMSLHLDTLSWFKANQSLLLLLNAACLAKKQPIPISIFGLTRPGLKTMLYHTLQVNTLPLHHMMWSYNFSTK